MIIITLILIILLLIFYDGYDKKTIKEPKDPAPSLKAPFFPHARFGGWIRWGLDQWGLKAKTNFLNC